MGVENLAFKYIFINKKVSVTSKLGSYEYIIHLSKFLSILFQSYIVSKTSSYYENYHIIKIITFHFNTVK